ncbi:hypothetical protein AGMMS49525_05090 [Bacteroidia bacterium]|nr:hypothetical protein AGMMS49525_05090 [Bacteroidia bacterium]
MKTTKEKSAKKGYSIDEAINKRIAEGKPLSAIAKYWQSEDGGNWEIVDMRAVLK